MFVSEIKNLIKNLPDDMKIIIEWKGTFSNCGGIGINQEGNIDISEHLWLSMISQFNFDHTKTISYLKEKLKNLPDDMEVSVSGSRDLTWDGMNYYSSICHIDKTEIKTKTIKSYDVNTTEKFFIVYPGDIFATDHCQC